MLNVQVWWTADFVWSLALAVATGLRYIEFVPLDADKVIEHKWLTVDAYRKYFYPFFLFLYVATLFPVLGASCILIKACKGVSCKLNIKFLSSQSN
jgi:hypothetical protein